MSEPLTPSMPIGPIREVRGTAVAIRGDDIDTDRIMPARFLRVLTFEGLGAHVFEDDRRAAISQGGLHPLDDPRFASASIVVADRNFGCGSSREHAPQGLLRRGIRALVGVSFSEIFFGNAAMLGMPCVTAEPSAIAAIADAVERDPATAVTVDLDALRVRAGGLTVPVHLPTALRDAFLDGSWDATGLLLEQFDEVRDLTRRLPYMNDWREP